MKPSNWSQLPRREKLRLGTDLFASPHGKHLLSQALCYGIAALQVDPTARPEVSDIEDMEILYETIFDQFVAPRGH